MPGLVAGTRSKIEGQAWRIPKMDRARIQSEIAPAQGQRQELGTTTLHAPQTARWSAPRLRARRPSSQRGAPSLFPCRSISALGWGSAHSVRHLAKRFPHEAPAAGSDAQSMSTNPAAPAWVPMTCTCFSSPTALQTVCVSGAFQAAGAPSPAAVPMWAAEDFRAVFRVRGGHIRRWENSCRCPDVPIVRTPVP